MPRDIYRINGFTFCSNSTGKITPWVTSRIIPFLSITIAKTHINHSPRGRPSTDLIENTPVQTGSPMSSNSKDEAYDRAEWLMISLERIAIACTDKPPRLAYDRGTIWLCPTQAIAIRYNFKYFNAG
jgi:hypothetical protein